MCREPQWKHCAGNDLDVNPLKTQTLEKEEESTVYTSIHYFVKQTSFFK